MTQTTRRELLPGVWLRSVHTDKFKSSYMAVTMLAPLEQEHAAENGLIPYVLRRGTQVHPDMESLSAALDELYGGAIEPMVRKKGETQCVGFAASFLDDAYALNGEDILGGAANLLGEILLKPYTHEGAFCPDYTASERGNLIDRIRGQINDKRRFALQRLIQIMGEEEAYGVDVLGDEASAAAITEKSLWARYQQLLETSEIEVYYCGSADEARVEQVLTAALSNLPRGAQRNQPDCEIRLHASAEPRVVEQAMDVSQGKLSMGFRTGGITCWEDEYPALVMCNTIFGGSTMSKLFMNVREKLSLCYYASSMLEKMKGVVLVYSGIEFDKYQVAKDEILFQLEAIRRGEIEDWELEGARRTLIGGHLSTLDDQGRLEDFWLGQAAAGLDTGIEELVAAFETVTREEISAVARKLELDTVYFLKGLEG